MNRSSNPLIPRKVLFSDPDIESPRLSPDGTKISYLAPVNGALNVWVGPADDPSEARPITGDKRGIRIYFWAYTNRHILYLQDKNGDENWHIYCVDPVNGQNIDLTPFDGVNARIQHMSPRFPNRILVGLNDQNPELHDIYSINIETEKRTLLEKNDGFSGYVVDEDFNIRFAMRYMPDGSSEMLECTDGMWRIFRKIKPEDTIITYPLGFNKEGNVLYMVDSFDRDTAALIALNTATGDRVMIAHDDRADFATALIHPEDKNIQAAAFTYERRQWQVLDPSIEDDIVYLKTAVDGDLEVASRTLDDRQWIVAYAVDNGPVRFYSYDREKKKMNFLFTNRKSLEVFTLARMQSVIIKSRDGLDLVSYLSLPFDRIEDEPMPLVVYVHGGPWSRDEWGYNPNHQWLANRGYAVLSVNYRGSAGFGKKFFNAGNLEWGGKMHADLLDAVHWAVNEGIADPERIAIMGKSYGGYAALAGMAFTPEQFACGVDIVGPSNLVTLLNSIPPYWVPEIELFRKRVGDHLTEAGRLFLKHRSPVNYAGWIKRPLLICHGANDPRVRQSESDQIVRIMREKNLPVIYLLYPDEGHGLVRHENRLSFSAVAEIFLSRCLHGRCEPAGDDLGNSSMTVPAGAEFIPGLKEAIGDK